MDQLTKHIRIAWQKWLRASGVFRLLTVWVGVIVIVIAGVLWQNHNRSSRQWLLAGQQFSQAELNGILMAFGEAGLNDYEIKDHRILIPRKNRSEYIHAMSQHGAMPGFTHLAHDEADKSVSPFFESATQREDRRQRALELGLGNSIQRMPGIESAIVYIDESVSGKGLQRYRTATAVVTVQHTPGKELKLERIESIRSMVAAAKVELTPANVSVTDLESGITYRGENASQPKSDYAVHKIRYERSWNEKIRSVLKIEGAEVSTNVDLEFATPNGSHVQTWIPARVAATVSIPDSFYSQVQQQIKASGSRASTSIEEIESATHARVRKSIARLLPGTETDTATCVTVVTLPSIAETLAAADDPPESTVLIPQSSLPSVLVCGLLISILALYGLRREDGYEHHEARLDTIRYPEEVEHDDDRLSSESATAVENSESYQDELSRLVRENPAAAAESLKQWINKAG